MDAIGSQSPSYHIGTGICELWRLLNALLEGEYTSRRDLLSEWVPGVASRV